MSFFRSLFSDTVSPSKPEFFRSLLYGHEGLLTHADMHNGNCGHATGHCTMLPF
jgi:hypothetical protein